MSETAVFSESPVRLTDEVRVEVERQLLLELAFYGIRIPLAQLRIDWSEATAEGKSARYLDGTIENSSGVQVLDEAGEVVAAGWVDFIYAQEQDRPIVYWDLVSIFSSTPTMEKDESGIPIHIWRKLSTELRDFCALQPEWSEDLLVQAWKKNKI